MSCQRWKAILFDFARGLHPVEEEAARVHLQACASCRDEFSEQRQLTEQLNHLAIERNHSCGKISAELIVAFRKSKQSVWRDVFVWMRAAVLILAILACWIWYRSINSPQNVSSNDDTEYTFEEFIPLQYANPAVNSRQVVRVKLGSSALEDLGFPRVPEWEHSRVEADIIVGDDGLPQAIRFVNLSQ
jgi:hypothetical protein